MLRIRVRDGKKSRSGYTTCLNKLRFKQKEAVRIISNAGWWVSGICSYDGGSLGICSYVGGFRGYVLMLVGSRDMFLCWWVPGICSSVGGYGTEDVIMLVGSPRTWIPILNPDGGTVVLRVEGTLGNAAV